MKIPLFIQYRCTLTSEEVPKGLHQDVDIIRKKGGKDVGKPGVSRLRNGSLSWPPGAFPLVPWDSGCVLQGKWIIGSWYLVCTNIDFENCILHCNSFGNKTHVMYYTVESHVEWVIGWSRWLIIWSNCDFATVHTDMRCTCCQSASCFENDMAVHSEMQWNNVVDLVDSAFCWLQSCVSVLGHNDRVQYPLTSDLSEF